MFDSRTTKPTTTELIDALRAAEQAEARALQMLAAMDPAEIARDAAMPAEMALALGGGRPRWKVRRMLAAAETLRTLPKALAALRAGSVSATQASEIAYQVKDLAPAARERIDALVAGLAPRLTQAEPEALIEQVQDACMALRPDLAARRQDRRVESRYLAIQPYLDGSGASLAGELDAAGLASLSAAVDARAEVAFSRDDPEAPSRGAQRAEALISICEDSLCGGSADGAARTRARPRMLLCVDVKDLADPLTGGARVLWGAIGAPGRLSPLAAGLEACDAEHQVVVFDGPQPLAVSDPRAELPRKIRTAVIARDGGCRFPGCSAPASWSDVHHVRAKGGNHLSNLVLLCRRCHGRVHRRVWRIQHRADATIAFTHRGRTYASVPRARPLRI